MSGPHRLFSYGTLRLPEVQAELFGRAVPTADDALPGWRLDWLAITDPAVIAVSGTDRHPVLRPGAPEDRVEGSCLLLDDRELARADEYEVDDYARVPVVLASGARAWAYVAADDVP